MLLYHINSNGFYYFYAKQIDKSGNVVAIDVLIDDLKVYIRTY